MKYDNSLLTQHHPHNIKLAPAHTTEFNNILFNEGHIAICDSVRGWWLFHCNAFSVSMRWLRCSWNIYISFASTAILTAWWGLGSACYRSLKADRPGMWQQQHRGDGVRVEFGQKKEFKWNKIMQHSVDAVSKYAGRGTTTRRNRIEGYALVCNTFVCYVENLNIMGLCIALHSIKLGH